MANYNFYLIPYESYSADPAAGANGMIDIEATFNCKYCSFTGLMEDGDAKNIYTEEYAEGTELRVFTPDPDELTHNTTECKLTLLWQSNEDYAVQSNERAFQNFVFGRRLVYYDTFRKKYFSLLMQKQPTKGEERLYSGKQYRQVTYTFTNLAGKPYDTNPINNA
jgi:hypothetical protein